MVTDILGQNEHISPSTSRKSLRPSVPFICNGKCISGNDARGGIERCKIDCEPRID